MTRGTYCVAAATSPAPKALSKEPPPGRMVSQVPLDVWASLPTTKSLGLAHAGGSLEAFPLPILQQALLSLPFRGSNVKVSGLIHASAHTGGRALKIRSERDAGQRRQPKR